MSCCARQAVCGTILSKVFEKLHAVLEGPFAETGTVDCGHLPAFPWEAARVHVSGYPNLAVNN